MFGPALTSWGGVPTEPNTEPFSQRDLRMEAGSTNTVRVCTSYPPGYTLPNCTTPRDSTTGLDITTGRNARTDDHS